MKKKFWLLGTGVGAICALGWWTFHPRPLNLSLRVENATVETPLMGDPLAKRISVLPAPEMPPHDKIINSQCVWTLQSVQYRRDTNAPWNDVTPAPQQRNAPVHLYSQDGQVGYSDIFFPLYQKAGEWKSVVRADVGIKTFFGRWHGNATHEILDVVTAADLRKRIAKRAAVKRQEERDIGANSEGSAPVGATPLVDGKRYISKIQWSEDAGQNWHDVPAGGKGAVAVPSLTSLGLRAVKADPKINWPDYPDFLPFWNYNGQKYFGDVVFVQVQGVSSSDSDLRTATAHCGQRKEVKIRVLPPGELVVYAASEPQTQPTASTKNSQIIRVYVRSAARQMPRDAKIRFVALYADSSRADLINKPGFKDDTVPLRNNRSSALVRQGAKTGAVMIMAQLLDKNNQPLANSDVNAFINFAAPTP